MAMRKVCTLQEHGSGDSKMLIGKFIDQISGPPLEIVMAPTQNGKPPLELKFRQGEKEIRITGMFFQKDRQGNDILSGNIRASTFYRIYHEKRWEVDAVRGVS